MIKERNLFTIPNQQGGEIIRKQLSIDCYRPVFLIILKDEK